MMALVVNARLCGAWTSKVPKTMAHTRFIWDRGNYSGYFRSRQTSMGIRGLPCLGACRTWAMVFTSTGNDCIPAPYLAPCAYQTMPEQNTNPVSTYLHINTYMCLCVNTYIDMYLYLFAHPNYVCIYIHASIYV